MKKNAIDPENFFLVEYTSLVDEIKLNRGFRNFYLEEKNIPVLFIFSNFPHTVKTNKQLLMGRIRTHVEERKGIIFFPTAMKEDVKQFVHEALKKEKVDLDFHPYSGEIYNPDYLIQICDTCFSIKNIKLKEVIKMAQKNEQPKNIHQEMIEYLEQSEDKEVTCFIIDRADNQIIKSLNLEQHPSPKKDISFEGIVKNKAFKPLFFDLFLAENSIPNRLKRFYAKNDWKFHSLLIFYSGRKKRIFIQDLSKSVFFFNGKEDAFMTCNTEYFLVSENYEIKPYERIIIEKNNNTQRFDISVDGKSPENPSYRRSIMSTFPGCNVSINEFLSMITHTQANESRFFYDKMFISIKIAGNKYTIDAYETK